MASVILKNINKVYSGDVLAVDNINLNIEDKEFLVLVGPSGCGKSTTLRMIAGLEEITSGELYIGDTLCNDIEPKDRDIAMVFQNYALYPHMTVYENMAFSLKMRKIPKKEIKSKVEKSAKILGIEEYLDRKPKALSGGQRQRVALGRAIVRDPEVFLMDEPLSNLDAKLRVQMRAEILKLHKNLNTTFIYVTHDQTEAMTMGDRIVVMKDGVIQQVDSPRNIYENPVNLFVAGFIGNPPMNFIESKIIQENNKLYISFSDVKLEIPEDKAKLIRNKNYINKEVIFGIRPEHISANPRFIELNQNTQLTAKVDVVENMGSMANLYLIYDDISFAANVDSSTNVDMRDNINLAMDMDKMYIFDKETESTIL
ncbi:sn-glycerol-3-phosphate ABC transporter ATP-binding protein UgpC [Tissierella sp. MSJ-40]|uniref:Sn-glycerol-3-phosphate ABC transporter ATP-binding protein UgpC n=1 Tax=Tissierella simiarum TaxID=2841534 RepID=A0ABS6E1B1_9FIRM|nr:sn-glycerol-3-phosphate ABC transporter ATP-binding protein UgpC [Tissierella simiarum]MBU5436694.1 sn-glycerol-3-phosphate ABC transporter ATP-binding protein UgpC [Tissierella simiarum]